MIGVGFMDKDITDIYVCKWITKLNVKSMKKCVLIVNPQMKELKEELNNYIYIYILLIIYLNIIL